MAKATAAKPLTQQERESLISGGPQELPFRYSNRFVFYFIWMGGFLLFALWAFFFGEGFTDTVAIPAIDAYGTAGFVGVIVFIVGGYIFCFLFFFWLARKVTDRHGTATFHEDFAALRMGSRRIEIAYGEIEKLKYRIVLNQQHGGIGLGPMLYRLHIRTAKGKIIIPGSFKEAWECRKANDAPSAIAVVCAQLEARTGLEVKFVAK